MSAEFLCNLPKNLTTHLTHKLYSVFPKKPYRRAFILWGMAFWFSLYRKLRYCSNSAKSCSGVVIGAIP